MMENSKISVIMPVYGVEDYVGKAIESIQKQTYKNWEFFCVDDGTKDRSGEICDDMQQKIHASKSFTRKTAVRQAQEMSQSIKLPASICILWIPMIGRSRPCWKIW